MSERNERTIDAGGEAHDLVIRGGTVVDGTGSAPRRADVAINSSVSGWRPAGWGSRRHRRRARRSRVGVTLPDSFRLRIN